jgi:hypothetical protein
MYVHSYEEIVGRTGNVCHEVVFILYRYPHRVGLDSIVSITTRHGLDSPAFESGGKEIFRTRRDRPLAQLASCTMGSGSSPGGEERGRGADHPLI